MEKGRIYVLGSYVTEVIFEVDHLFTRRGEQIRGSFSISPGGKGLNAAVAAARAGADVRLCLKIGGDVFAEMGLDFLRKEKISQVRIIKDQNQHSGIGVAIKEIGTGENMVAADLGANQTLTFNEIPHFKADIRESNVFLTNLEVLQPTVEKALMEAKKINPGIITILNPGPIPTTPLSDHSLKAIDVLTPNETEAFALAGPEASGDIQKAASILIGKGVQNVIITLGEKGALLISRKRKLLIPPPKVKALDALGAGDAFNGALAVALAEGAGIEEAIKFSVKAAALKVTRKGTCEAMPTREEIDSFIF